jgi:hypothetical protein
VILCVQYGSGRKCTCVDSMASTALVGRDVAEFGRCSHKLYRRSSLVQSSYTPTGRRLVVVRAWLEAERIQNKIQRPKRKYQLQSAAEAQISAAVFACVDVTYSPLFAQEAHGAQQHSSSMPLHIQKNDDTAYSGCAKHLQTMHGCMLRSCCVHKSQSLLPANCSHAWTVQCLTSALPN